MMGVLGPHDQVRCPKCSGGCTIEDLNCDFCEGEGVFEPKEDDFNNIENVEDYRSVIEAIYASAEHPLSINEFLNQSAKYAEAYKYLGPYLFGELTERRDKLRKNDNSN